MSGSDLSSISELASYYEDISQEFQFPSNYKLLGRLGEGAFGLVLKCFNTDTNKVVAMKVQEYDDLCCMEVTMMKLLMKYNLHECNIVRFIEMVELKGNNRGLVFEWLDLTLQEHLIYNNNATPLDIHGVRSVIQQMAIALDALKNLGIIHADIKLDNIMLVDAVLQPLKVRLIDFGLAIPAGSVRQGTLIQPLDYMAPEVILGLPITGAIDMWSLGIVMMEILTGDALFLAKDKYGTLRNIVEIIGLPPQHLLEAGVYSTVYFNCSPCGQWELKAPEEFWQDTAPPEDPRVIHVSNLDEVALLSLPHLEGVDTKDIEECIDLLKAMVRFDPKKRITPSQVLAHPFIRRGNLQSSVEETHSSQAEEPETTEAERPETTETEKPETTEAERPETTETDKPETTEAERPETTETERPGTTETDKPGTKEADRPETTETDRPGTTETFGQIVPSVPSVSSVHPVQNADCLPQKGNVGLSCSHTIGFSIQVRPASPENILAIEEDTEDQFHHPRNSCPPSFHEESIISDDTDLDDVQPIETKKKKKNIVTRFFCWMKKKVLCCNNIVDIQD